MKLEDFKSLCRKPSGLYDYDKAAEICYDAKRAASYESLAAGRAHCGQSWDLIDKYFLATCKEQGLDVTNTTKATIGACFYFAKQH